MAGSSSVPDCMLVIFHYPVQLNGSRFLQEFVKIKLPKSLVECRIIPATYDYSRLRTNWALAQSNLKNLLHFKIEKLDECSKDAVFVEQRHVLATTIHAFGIALAFKPTSWKAASHVFAYGFFKVLHNLIHPPRLHGRPWSRGEGERYAYRYTVSRLLFGIKCSKKVYPVLM